MSDVNLHKPAPDGAGKPWLGLGRGDILVVSLFGASLVAALIFPYFPAAKEAVSDQWKNKCVSYDGVGGYVSSIDPGGEYVTVRRDGVSTVLDRVAITNLSKADCSIALDRRDDTPPPAKAAAASTDGLTEHQNAIARLKYELEIMQLRLELARAAKEYHDLLTGEGTAGGNDILSQDTAGAEIGDNKRRIDRLKMEIERSKIANDYYNSQNRSPTDNTSR